jgi:hypothetical protein
MPSEDVKTHKIQAKPLEGENLPAVALTLLA